MSGTPRLKPHGMPELMLTVQYGTRCADMPPPARLRTWARAALLKSARITLRLIGEREARKLNREYRGRDYATNVLTFVYSKKNPLEGDIAICAPVVAREAKQQGRPRDAHYAHLTVHGILHLQGFGHERTPAAKRMETLETRILARLGYADPYRAIEPALKKPAKRISRSARQSA
jgi:probable rRNA maturation factor